MNHKQPYPYSQRFRVQIPADAVNSTETAVYERPILSGSKNVASKILVTGWYVLRSPHGQNRQVFSALKKRGDETIYDIMDGPFAFRQDARKACTR